MNLCLGLFHRWSKWESYTAILPARKISKRYQLCMAREYRQRRTCEKCGKVQDKCVHMEVLP